MPIDIFNQLNKKDHAVLLVCPKEEELKQTAMRFVLSLFCAQENPCHACAQCLKVMHAAHPDILHIKPDDMSIKVAQVRQITDFIAEKAFEGGKKVVLIEKCELMTPEAQNCLLKPVEEPPENTVFILLARSENTVLPTIASRCKRLRIKPLGLHEAASRIAEMTGLEKHESLVYASYSGGYVSEALRLIKDENFQDIKEKTIEMCEKICASKNMAIQKHVDFLEERKDSFALILKIMLSYFYDLQWMKLTGEAEKLKNTDRAKEITNNSLNFTRSALSNIIDLLCEMERRLRFALNYRLMTENMLLNILEVKNGKGYRRAF